MRPNQPHLLQKIANKLSCKRYAAGGLIFLQIAFLIRVTSSILFSRYGLLAYIPGFWLNIQNVRAIMQ